MILYFFRATQYDTINEAANDDALHCVGAFEVATKRDQQLLAQVKSAIAIACEACDMRETARFVEVSTANDFYPLDKEHADE